MWTERNKPMSKTININDNEFSVSNDADFLTIAQSTPNKVGDVVVYKCYDIRVDPPKLISENEIVTDAEQLAYIIEIRKHSPYPYIGEECLN